MTVAGISIPGGMIYVGGPHVCGGPPPPCYIDPNLEVARNAPETSGKGMTYWPSYASISPRCRLAYLQWLRNGRVEPTVYIGYVFLFFYGLERRAFVDRAEPREAAELIAEARRLLSIYGSNSSFRGYATGFVAAVELRALVETGFIAQNYRPVLDGQMHHMPMALKIAIATRVAKGEHLTFEMAMAGLLGLPIEVLLLSDRVLGQARPQFLYLMRNCFENVCPLGYKLADRKGPRLELKHRCATAGLTVDLVPSLSRHPLPDPAMLAWDKLIAMASQVATQLEDFAKLKERHPERARTLSALTKLPEGFAVEALGPAASNARRWLETLPKPISRVGFAELAEHAIGERSAKWTLRHHRAVNEALAATEYGLEPHPEDGSVAIVDTTPVYVFPDAGARRERTPSYTAAALGAELVNAVSRANPASAAAAQTDWLANVGARLPLSDPDLIRLDARLRWLEHTAPPTTVHISKRLSAVSAADRATVAKLAAGATAAAGALAKEQIGLLEKIYDEFGLERGELYSAIHDAAATGKAIRTKPAAGTGVQSTPQTAEFKASGKSESTEPSGVAVPLRRGLVAAEGGSSAIGQENLRLDEDARSSAARSPSGQTFSAGSVADVDPVPATEPVVVAHSTPDVVHRIPPPSEPTRSAPTLEPPSSPIIKPTPLFPSPAIGLDAERIRKIKAETARVQSVLANIFTDQEIAPTAPVAVSTGDALAELGAPCAKLLRTLATKTVWSRAEFDTAACDSGLLPDGALETINEWAYDRFNAPLLEDGDTVSVDIALLNETGLPIDVH